MANRITFLEARNDYERLVTSVLPIDTAIQEAVNLYYDLGRWPGTTREVKLADESITFDGERRAWVITLDDAVYDGVIGFRNNERGWNIRSQICLYRDKLNSGDLDFIDLESRETAGVAWVPATFTTDVEGVACNLRFDQNIPGTIPLIQIVGEDGEGDPRIETTVMGNVIRITAYSPGPFLVQDFLLSFDSNPEAAALASCDYTTAITDAVFTQNPTIDLNVDGTLTGEIAAQPARSDHTYRCPLNFGLSNGPYYALCKLDAPQLVNDSDIVPIPSTAALKALIMAVSYETANDPQRQQAAMQEFESVMSRSSREIQGRRSMPLMTTTTTRRRPQQFP